MAHYPPNGPMYYPYGQPPQYPDRQTYTYAGPSDYYDADVYPRVSQAPVEWSSPSHVLRAVEGDGTSRAYLYANRPDSVREQRMDSQSHHHHRQAHPAHGHSAAGPSHQMSQDTYIPSGNRGRDYLLGLPTSIASLEIGSNTPEKYEKPLPPPPADTKSNRKTTNTHTYPSHQPSSSNSPFTAPALPKPPSIPPRPISEPIVPVRSPPVEPVPPPHRGAVAPPSPSTPTKPVPASSPHARGYYFTPSFHPDTPPRSNSTLLRPPHLTRPRPLSESAADRKKTSSTGRYSRPVIDLTLEDEGEGEGEGEGSSGSEDHSESSPTHLRAVTKRSPARRRRAQSSQLASPGLLNQCDQELSTNAPRTKARNNSYEYAVASPSSRPQNTPRIRPSPAHSGSAVCCSGFTKEGAPCKRLVKAQAPFLAQQNFNLPTQTQAQSDGGEAAESVGRYCRDHAGMICDVKGFYPRGTGKRNWIEFDSFIPSSLGEQTRALLRVTMESQLTDKDLPGFLYVYELRDLQSPTTSFYKVGRTENVPRRISQWTSQCQSHTPTLRDIFPPRHPPSRHLPSHHDDLSQSQSELSRRPTGSFLPGAFHSGSTTDDSRPRIPAMKRWERLVHLELSDNSSNDCPVDWEKIRERCGDCGTVHKEIFPMKRITSRPVHDGMQKGEVDAYDAVWEVVMRWAAFVSEICPSSAET